jgi:Restriction endonuclease
MTTLDVKSTELSDDDMRKEADKWTRSDLLKIWDEVKAGRQLPNWKKGHGFEYLVIKAFQLDRVRVRWPYRVTYPQKFGTMEQIDGIVYQGERAFLVESKDLSEPLAIEAVAKLRFRLESRPPGTMGILFSTTGFTLPTEVFTQFASPLNVLLWDRGDMDLALQSEGAMKTALTQKLEFAIEEGIPLYKLEGAK